jgi:hypothetical protein
MKLRHRKQRRTQSRVKKLGTMGGGNPLFNSLKS